MSWKKEIKIYLLLFILLSVAMHFSAWTDHPITHIQALKESSLGLFHPFVISFLVYLLILIVRLVWGWLKRVFQS